MADRLPHLVVFTDRRHGDRTFTMTVPPDSPWYDLLEPVTEAEIRVLTEAERADDAAYRAAGGLVLANPPASKPR